MSDKCVVATDVPRHAFMRMCAQTESVAKAWGIHNVQVGDTVALRVAARIEHGTATFVDFNVVKIKSAPWYGRLRCAVRRFLGGKA